MTGSNHSDDIQTIMESLEFTIVYFREQIASLRNIQKASDFPDARVTAEKQIQETEKQVTKLRHAMIFVEDMSRRKLI